MGGGNIKGTNLKQSELSDFHSMSSLSNDLLVLLHKNFTYISSVYNDDGVIDYPEFCYMLNKKDNLLIQKIFSSIDINKDKKVNFREFLKFLSIFLNGTHDEHCKIIFKILSDDTSKLIDKSFLESILKDCINSDKILSSYFDEESIMQIVSESFERIIYNSENNSTITEQIDYELFKEMLDNNKFIINWLKIDIKKIKLFRRSSIGCFG